MNKAEKDEISQLPYEYRPLTMWSIIGWNILFNIFFIGFILTIIFSFNRGNINRRSLARYWLLVKLLLLVVIGLAVAVLYFTGYLQIIIDYVRDAVGSVLAV